MKNEKKSDTEAGKIPIKSIMVVESELKQDPYRVFNVAFALMTIIPFLIFFYLLATEFFGMDIFVGKTGLILTITLVIAVLGYYTGYLIINNMLDKVMFYAAEVRKSDELKTLFVASVSHEVRNPLAILRTNIFTISAGMAGDVNEEQKGILNTCYDTIKRISRLVDDLLNLYKIESGMVKADIAECDPDSLMKALAKENAVILEKKKIELITEISEDAKTILCDRDKILQVMHNFLSNAVKYVPEGSGRITMRIFRTAEGIKIECEDNGTGIPEDKVNKIFDKFERLGSKKEGIGLGLAISRNIIELHKGKIWAESRLGKWTKIIALLPFDPRKEKEKNNGK